LAKKKTRTNRTFIQKAKVWWCGMDIAPYLYGYSLRVHHPEKGYVGGDELRQIVEAVSLNHHSKLFGVELKPVRTESDLTKGSFLLRLDAAGGSFTKHISVVTDLKPTDHGLYVHTESVWPEFSAGGNGFFLADLALKPEQYPDSVWMRFSGNLPDQPKSDGDLFFIKMHELATEFSILVECWSIVDNPKTFLDGPLDFNPFGYYWLEKFGKKHGRRYQHEDVYWTMMAFRETGDMRGINKVYDTRPYRSKDLISPLLARLQQDILDVLYLNSDLADQIFSDAVGDLWLRVLEPLFVKFYGPKSVVYVSDVAVAQPSDWTDHRLTVIQEIIARGTTTPGMIEAAKRAWFRLTGQEYDE